MTSVQPARMRSLGWSRWAHAQEAEDLLEVKARRPSLRGVAAVGADLKTVWSHHGHDFLGAHGSEGDHHPGLGHGHQVGESPERWWRCPDRGCTGLGLDLIGDQTTSVSPGDLTNLLQGYPGSGSRHPGSSWPAQMTAWAYASSVSRMMRRSMALSLSGTGTII